MSGKDKSGGHYSDTYTPEELRRRSGEDHADDRPPDNPPIVKHHGSYVGSYIHEEYKRRIFGTPPTPGSKRPIPPPPPPPNSYHKKPKYWQLRGTSHMELPNRAAGLVAIGSVVVAIILDRYWRHGFDRWDRWFGIHMTTDEKYEYDQKNVFYHDNMSQISPNAWHTNLTGDYYKNTRRHNDANVRWDIREVDLEITGTRDMCNPFDDPL